MRELGYPTERNLKRWIRLWEASSASIESVRRKPRYSAEQKKISVEHYLSHGCCLAFTSRTLGNPCTDVYIFAIQRQKQQKRSVVSDAVCYRVGDSRQSGRRATGGPKIQNGTADEFDVRLDTAANGHAVATLRYGEGVRISTKQWDALNEYCRNGWVEIDNNQCENALRGIALGRCNYMFFSLIVVVTVQQ